ncbi:unnamed protein product, partial [Rotaria sp. Silwood2]
ITKVETKLHTLLCYCTTCPSYFKFYAVCLTNDRK